MPSSPAKDYSGERSAKALHDWALSLVPNKVRAAPAQLSVRSAQPLAVLCELAGLC
jgi:hypothetical protein